MAVDVISILEVADYESHLAKAAERLSRGELVVLPTETVYGVAARADHPQALQRLREFRGGNGDRPFTVHLSDPQQAWRYLGEVSHLGRRMMQKLWPGPVGLVFSVPAERRQQVAGELKIAESDLYDGELITLRCPDHWVAQTVIGQVDAPVVAAAASVGGDFANVTGQHLACDLDGKVELILDAGPTRYPKPSTIIRVDADRYEVVRAGIYDERIIERLLKTVILFVCSGNTCRSPMAEAIAKQVIAEKLSVTPDELEPRGVLVLSAGAMARAGSPATPQAVEAVRDLGADLSRHRSRPLTVELIHQADLIFTMGDGHAHAVKALAPSAADKVMALDPEKDVEDPIGGDVALYRDLASRLRTLIQERLKDRALP